MLNTSLLSLLVLVLHKFIKIYSESLMETAGIKIRSSLSVHCLLTINVPALKEAVKMPQEFDFPTDKN